jgi:hypothetical protein
MPKEERAILCLSYTASDHAETITNVVGDIHFRLFYKNGNFSHQHSTNAEYPSSK